VSRQPRIGIALGGGAARGWAHIGVLQALARHGVVPEVVTGSSIGALVGAAFAANRLDALDAWVRALSGLDVLKLLDARIAGGMIEGNRVMQAIERILPDLPIETLERPYAAVATDLRTGRPVWLRSGSTIAAVRASCAMPGLMPPRRHEHRWLVDGGLVDPVPVTLCRVLGADLVIAVDISAYRHRQHGGVPQSTELSGEPPVETGPESSADFEEGVRWGISAANELRAYVDRLQSFVGGWLESGSDDAKREPGLFDVVAASINIMQQSITRSRLAGDPPDLELTPDLAGIGLMDFHKASDAIAAGESCVEERAAEVRALLRLG
jgi:NTE family protein